MFLVMQDFPNDAMVLVDRHKVKNKWWTRDLSEAMIFRKESAARIQKSKLRHGDVRVVTLETAKKILNEVELERTHQQALDACEMDYLSECGDK